MPGVSQWSVDTLLREAPAIVKEDIPALILFGIPDDKDAVGSAAWREDGIIQKALGALKKFMELRLVPT